LIRRMLEPEPKGRATIEEVVRHAWVEGIEVCTEVERPRHVHVCARAAARAMLGEGAE
jgi:protein-serine/threonine kinase